MSLLIIYQKLYYCYLRLCHCLCLCFCKCDFNIQYNHLGLNYWAHKYRQMNSCKIHTGSLFYFIIFKPFKFCCIIYIVQVFSTKNKESSSFQYALCVANNFGKTPMVMYFVDSLPIISTTVVSMQMETIFNQTLTACLSWSTTQMIKLVWVLLMKCFIQTQINCTHTIQVYNLLINSPIYRWRVVLLWWVFIELLLDCFYK